MINLIYETLVLRWRKKESLREGSEDMTHSEKRLYLIRKLINELADREKVGIPANGEDQKRLLRSLMNVRAPGRIDPEFLSIQDEYLTEALADEGITDFRELVPIEPDLYLWRGDITRLRCGAIVNAANSGMTGCYVPCHNCIDNCIHTYAGIQLRLACDEIMRRQGHPEETGKAKITPAFNLPCDYVIHTVGPIVNGRLTEREEGLLSDCYLSCLALAEENDVESIAFCCISTGVFLFPNDRAAEIAVDTVKQYKKEHNSSIKVIFNVFKELDEQLYRRLLGGHSKA